MINSNMRYYPYSTFGELDDYGQPQLSEPKGEVKMSLHLLSQTTQDNIFYNGASYIGLTKQEVNDTYVITYGNEKLKVLYVNPYGRYKQVYLCRLD